MATFAEYWDGVLGANMDAADVVREFRLTDSSRQAVCCWLGGAESDARAAGADISVTPAERERVVDALVKAVEESLPDCPVLVETMPDQHRDSHRAAGNWGRYPDNGAERSILYRAEAEALCDGDEYDHIVRPATQRDIDRYL